jgi:ABC-type amino acid transport system permease subunit
MIDNEFFRELLTGWRAAVITFSVNEGAYMTEIVRAGIQAIRRPDGRGALCWG